MAVLFRAYELCCQRQSYFDFTDMVYLPIRQGLPLIQYDVVLIDEAQDLNAIQIEMISR
jgi:superfamily I DNA/RNA helicase